MITVTMLGYVAAALTSMSFIPQAWLIIRTRNVEGISILMYMALTTGVAFWLIYGVLTQAAPLIVANSITLALSCVILYTAASERVKRRRLAP